MAPEKRNLIDRDELVEYLRGRVSVVRPNLFPGLFAAIDYVEESPTMDAVEVVRCKDCQNCKVKQMSIPGDDLSRQFPMYVCEHPRGEVGTDPLYMEADDFCSYGERRTDA